MTAISGIGFRSSRHEDGMLRIEFDLPGEKVNLLNADILRGLAPILDDARENPEIRGVLFCSAKPKMFLAGMDVEQIGGVKDAYEAAEGARQGQAVFQKIADLGKPSACAIGGTCLGGGTELALACTFRVAAKDPSVQIGLPEVKLGIIPGFGGTQRMPRLIGLAPSLDLILSGRSLDSRRARKLGLVDLVVPAAYVVRESANLLQRAADRGVANTVAKLKRPVSWMRRAERFGFARKYMMDQARKRLSGKVTPEQYPAPFRALEAIDAAYTLPLSQGLDAEARIIGELIPTATAGNLIWLFKTQNALKGEGGGVQAAPRKVNRVGVLGAGIMGGGIAQLAADRGIPVRLRDLNNEAILTALKTAQGIWDYKLKRKRLTRSQAAQKMAFIAPSLSLTGLQHVDVVIEAVVEKLEIKRKVLAEVEQLIHDRTVFATNTSSLPIGEIAAGARYPERVIGMHYFNPVHRMPLIEIIAGPRTSPEAVATIHALSVRMGKVPVVVKDGPGFLVNRILTFYLNEAAQLLSEGVRIEALDRAMLDFGMPMGPFALMDQVGLDTGRHVGEVLRAAFGKRAGETGPVLDKLVDAGRLGQKNEKGFYRYRAGKRTVPDPAVYELIGSPATRELPPETIQERMILAMANEAALCLAEGVARDARDIDMALVMGTGFPPFRGGLLRYADSVGVPVIADRLARLADAHGGRFAPAEIWGEMVRDQRRFYPQVSSPSIRNP